MLYEICYKIAKLEFFFSYFFFQTESVRTETAEI